MPTPDPTPDRVRDRSITAMTRFGLMAAGVLIVLAIAWFVLHAAVRPDARSDATAAGVAASTTPPDAVNGAAAS